MKSLRISDLPAPEPVYELVEMGAKKAQAFPLLFDPKLLDVEPDVHVFNKFVVPMTNILFVGRISPNKYIEDLLVGQLAEGGRMIIPS